ncbi:MAG TPA: hypothetical protein VHF69_01845, partial [Candidatus Synoicihabitans sp.]|nr:hypothetical protein [Candidatus Synoicihabitans sp.]
MPHALIIACLGLVLLRLPALLLSTFREWSREDSYHLELLADDGRKRVYLLRYFSGPRGIIDQKTGQPYRKYDGTCTLVVDTLTRLCEVKGILRIPRTAFWKLRGQIRDEIGVSSFWGERWRTNEKRMVFVPVLLVGLMLWPGCQRVPSSPERMPRPVAAPVLQAHAHKDEVILSAADRIDAAAMGSSVEVPVSAFTAEQRAAVAAAPAQDLAALVQSFDRAMTAAEDRAKAANERAIRAEKQVEALKDVELKTQVRTLRWIGLGAFVAAGLLVWARQFSFGATVALVGLGALGLAQVVSQPWFMPAVGITAALALVAFGIAAWHNYRKGTLAAKVAHEADKLRGTLAKVVPVLDDAYDNADASVREVLDKTIFESLSRVMDHQTKAVVHQLRADASS